MNENLFEYVYKLEMSEHGATLSPAYPRTHKAAFLLLTNVDSDPRDGSQQVRNGSNRHCSSVWSVKFSLGKAEADLK